MNTLRWLLAQIMWALQVYVLRPRCSGRHTDWEPVRCEDCGWRGPRRWCFHTYHGCGEDDVEPADECPQCGMEV